jgi:hypothetical protein
MISESMPANSDAVPLLGTYFNCVMFMIASSVVSTVVVNLGLRSGPNKAPRQMSGRMRRVLLNWIPRTLRMEQVLGQGGKGRVLKLAHGLGQGLVQKQKQDALKINPKFQDLKESIISELPGKNSVFLTEEEVRMEWKFAAIVVDRLALLTSILFAVASTIVLLVSAI